MNDCGMFELLKPCFENGTFSYPVRGWEATIAVVEWLHSQGVKYREIAKWANMSVDQFMHWRRGTGSRMPEQRKLEAVLEEISDEVLLDEIERKEGIRCVIIKDVDEGDIIGYPCNAYVDGTGLKDCDYGEC